MEPGDRNEANAARNMVFFGRGLPRLLLLSLLPGLRVTGPRLAWEARVSPGGEAAASGDLGEDTRSRARRGCWEAQGQLGDRFELGRRERRGGRRLGRVRQEVSVTARPIVASAGTATAGASKASATL